MYQFIVNPNAQGGRGIKIWKRLEHQLKRSCVEYHAHLTAAGGDARALASQLTGRNQGTCCIIVVGGDRTLSEVLDGLSFSGTVTVGYIPIGFFKDFARSIRLPHQPAAGLRRIICPKQHKQIDYGVISYGDSSIEHRRFLINVGIGMDASERLYTFTPKARKRLRLLPFRSLIELLVNFKQIAGLTPVKGHLLLDGSKKVEFNRLYYISVNIHPFTGGGFRLAPKANCSDGKLTICVVHSTSRIRLFPLCLRARLGYLGRDRGIRFYECQEADIHLEQPRRVCVDGQICHIQTDVHVECIERKLRVIK